MPDAADILATPVLKVVWLVSNVQVVTVLLAPTMSKRLKVEKSTELGTTRIETGKFVVIAQVVELYPIPEPKMP